VIVVKILFDFSVLPVADLGRAVYNPVQMRTQPFADLSMTTTPMRSQYLAIKKQYPDIILLFRLGDFYETFDDDAKIVASVCDVVLTSRPVGADERVPLAGVPYHAVDGYKVAIAEQIGNEPPKGEKLVPRVVRRVVTPGTVVEPALLSEKRNNYIAALILDAAPVPVETLHATSLQVQARRAGLAYADISTGEFATTEIGDGGDVQRRVVEELGRLGPAELLWPAKDPRWAGRMTNDERQTTDDAIRNTQSEAIPSWLQPYHVTPYATWRFEETTARQVLLDHFRAGSLDGYGCADKPLAVRAAGALIQYLAETQRDNVAQIAGLRTYDIGEYMLLDEATRRNLELTEGIRSGSVQGSLLGVLDATLTPMGGRLLRRWLNQPLLDVAALNRRLDAVTAWHADAPARTELRQSLRGLGDLERWTNRAVQGIALPRDLVGIREALARVEKIRSQGAGVRDREAGGRSQESGVRDHAARITQHALRNTQHVSTPAPTSLRSLPRPSPPSRRPR
jgi:DNA mismatch repair protein MutS